MNPKNLYNSMAHTKEITLHAPIASAHADKMILTLYGKEKLRELDAQTTNDNQLESWLYAQLLPNEPIQIDKMDTVMDKWEHIIPASAITQQYVNHKTGTITIPIEAFNNKRALVYHRNSPSTGQGMTYHYILMQSAKDPNIAYVLTMFVGTLSNKLVTVLSNQEQHYSRWDINIQQPHYILRYMDHYTKAWPLVPMQSTNDMKIQVPISLMEATQRVQSIPTFTMPVMPTLSQQELADMMKAWI